MSYQEYLQSDHWKAKRKEAFGVWGFECALCFENKHLHVHHVHYDTLWNEDPESDLVVLCANCHKVIHIADESFEIKYAKEFTLTEYFWMRLTYAWQ